MNYLIAGNFRRLLLRVNLRIKFSQIQGSRSPFSFRLKHVHLREWPKGNLSMLFIAIFEGITCTKKIWEASMRDIVLQEEFRACCAIHEICENFVL